ncbi:MAG: hypothetical protein ACRDG6_11610 [Candidatus Limnocylindria bacterium]
MAVIVVVVAFTFALFAQQAVATPPTSASGTFVATQVVTSTRTADGNTIITTDLSEVISGTYTGTTTGQSRVVVHADGSGNLHGEFVCDCTVAGQGSGTLLFRFAGTGAGGAFEGQYRVVGSSGGLAGTHGLGRFSVTAAGAGTYSGSQHYDP